MPNGIFRTDAKYFQPPVFIRSHFKTCPLKDGVAKVTPSGPAGASTHIMRDLIIHPDEKSLQPSVFVSAYRHFPSLVRWIAKAIPTGPISSLTVLPVAPNCIILTYSEYL
jgi:hypothetical protein